MQEMTTEALQTAQYRALRQLARALYKVWPKKSATGPSVNAPLVIKWNSGKQFVCDPLDTASVTLLLNQCAELESDIAASREAVRG